MELSGDLGDFPLADILQILALSRKSGTLSLGSGSLSGTIVVEQGRITHASLGPGRAFASRLVRENRVSSEIMRRLREVAEQERGVWTLRALLLESGVMKASDLDDLARRHISDTVAILVGLEKGRFGIELNQIQDIDTLDEVGFAEGLDIGEVLLGAAKEIDEFTKDHLVATVAGTEGEALLGQGPPGYWPIASQEDRPADKIERTEMKQARRQNQRATLLFSMLAELRSHSFEAEVSLLIMRYASEVASRGVLFVVKDEEICGLGQFGVKAEEPGTSPDEKVRKIRIPIGAKSIFDSVVNQGQPYIGALSDNHWHSELLKRIGGNGVPLSVFAIPLVCNDQPIFVFYGDNYPGQYDLTGIDELVALVNQASVVLEKIVLERTLSEMKRSN
jgi:hypothetical protein